jgi:hypothetical protein
MLQLFLDSAATGHMQFIPGGATVDKHRYKQLSSFAVSVLSSGAGRTGCCYTTPPLHIALCFGAGRTGCCYTTPPLHIALCLSKRSRQHNRSPFCHSLHTHLISHPAIYFPLPACKKNSASVNFTWSRISPQPQGKKHGAFLQVSFSSVPSRYNSVSRLA